jgi:hypothetical protein
MTRYFFDIQSGREFFLDEEGLELNGPTWRSRFAPRPSDCFALP